MYTYIFKNFPGLIPPDPHNWDEGKPPPQTPSPPHASTVPLLQSFRGRCDDDDDDDDDNDT